MVVQGLVVPGSEATTQLGGIGMVQECLPCPFSIPNEQLASVVAWPLPIGGDWAWAWPAPMQPAARANTSAIVERQARIENEDRGRVVMAGGIVS